MSRALCRALSLVFVVAAVGCGGSGLASVRGKVVFPDKKPVTGGSVVFVPTEEDREGAQGAIKADGTFQLSTKRPGDGALPGKYRVAIEAVDPPDDGITPKPPGQFDRKYENSTTSGLEFTVKPGGNDFEIVVQRPRKR